MSIDTAKNSRNLEGLKDTDLYNNLGKLSIEYSVLEHKIITTMAEGQEIMKKLSGCVPVNLLLKDKKGNYYLLVKDPMNRMKISEIEKKIGTKGLTMTKPDEMTRILKVPIGCTTIFALLNVGTSNIIVLLDDSITTEKINFHPLRNDATLTIKYDDMMKFINSCGNTCQKIFLKN